jgi:hypothetical protein
MWVCALYWFGLRKVSVWVFVSTSVNVCEIWGSHGLEVVIVITLGSDAMWTLRWTSKFPRKILCTSRGLLTSLHGVTTQNNISRLKDLRVLQKEKFSTDWEIIIIFWRTLYHEVSSSVELGKNCVSVSAGPPNSNVLCTVPKPFKA